MYIGVKKPLNTMILLLWQNRNKCYHNKRCDLPWSLADKAKRVVDEGLSQLNQTTCAHSQTIHVVWLPPPSLTLKINIDVAYDYVTCLANLGVVIRDHLGAILANALNKKVSADNPLQAKNYGHKTRYGYSLQKVF